MVKKVVDQRGEKNHYHKLNLTDISIIRQLRDNGYSQTKIAKMFEVSIATISMIFSGKRWRNA
jgi:transposase